MVTDYQTGGLLLLAAAGFALAITVWWRNRCEHEWVEIEKTDKWQTDTWRYGGGVKGGTELQRATKMRCEWCGAQKLEWKKVAGWQLSSSDRVEKNIKKVDLLSEETE